MLAGHTATFQVFKVTAPNKEGYAAAGVESRIGKDLLLGTQSAGIGSGRPGDYFGHSGDDNNEAEAAGVLPGTHDSQSACFQTWFLKLKHKPFHPHHLSSSIH